MKKLFITLIVIFCSFALAAVACAVFKNIPEDVSNLKTTTFTKFEKTNMNGINVGGIWEVSITQGEHTKATFTMPEKYKDWYSFKIENGNLLVQANVKNKHGFKYSNGKNPFKIELICNSLDNIKASGGVDIILNGNFNGNNLNINSSGGADVIGKGIISCNNAELNTSGGADMNINVVAINEINAGVSGGADFKASIEAKSLDVSTSGGADTYCTVKSEKVSASASGGADVKLIGTATYLTVSASGGADLNAKDLVAQNVEINASGGADVSVNAEKTLNVDRSGGADVAYKGNPAIKAVKIDGLRKIN